MEQTQGECGREGVREKTECEGEVVRNCECEGARKQTEGCECEGVREQTGRNCECEGVR